MATASSNRTHLLGYPIDLVSLEEGILRVAHYWDTPSESPQPFHVVTINPEIIMHGDRDPQLAAILKAAPLIIPDGAGVVWALKRKGLSSVHRIPGIEFSTALLKSCAQDHRRVALIGASPEVLSATTEQLSQQYPGLNLVFSHHGYFKNLEEEQHLAQACAEHHPHLVMVALGAPKQDKWIATYRHLFKQTAFIGVGGSFDIWSGTIRRAPQIFQKLGLEWLYRFSTQPFRIRRAGKNLMRFVVKVLQER